MSGKDKIYLQFPHNGGEEKGGKKKEIEQIAQIIFFITLFSFEKFKTCGVIRKSITEGLLAIGGVAQMVERPFRIREVTGSMPVFSNLVLLFVRFVVHSFLLLLFC